MEHCPCGSEKNYNDCCEPFIKGEKKPETAEQLMRSRYSAYVQVETDYLSSTILPEKRDAHDEKVAKDWAEKSEWQGLEVIKIEDGGPGDDKGTVEFIAHYTQKGERAKHHELATFVKHEETWYFEDGVGVKPAQVIRETPKVGRNDPCPCSSGKKYKKCCGK